MVRHAPLLLLAVGGALHAASVTVTPDPATPHIAWASKPVGLAGAWTIAGQTADAGSLVFFGDGTYFLWDGGRFQYGAWTFDSDSNLLRASPARGSTGVSGFTSTVQTASITDTTLTLSNGVAGSTTWKRAVATNARALVGGWGGIGGLSSASQAVRNNVSVMVLAYDPAASTTTSYLQWGNGTGLGEIEGAEYGSWTWDEATGDIELSPTSDLNGTKGYGSFSGKALFGTDSSTQRHRAGAMMLQGAGTRQRLVRAGSGPAKRYTLTRSSGAIANEVIAVPVSYDTVAIAYGDDFLFSSSQPGPNSDSQLEPSAGTIDVLFPGSTLSVDLYLDHLPQSTGSSPAETVTLGSGGTPVTLREDFTAAGLIELSGQVPARCIGVYLGVDGFDYKATIVGTTWTGRIPISRTTRTLTVQFEAQDFTRKTRTFTLETSQP